MSALKRSNVNHCWVPVSIRNVPAPPNSILNQGVVRKRKVAFMFVLFSIIFESSNKFASVSVLGDSCARSTECFVEKDPENVECRNSVCQCKLGYQANDVQKTCIRVVSSTKSK